MILNHKSLLIEKFIAFSEQQKQNLAKAASLLEQQSLMLSASRLSNPLVNKQVDSPESVMARASKPIINAGYKLLRK